MQKRKLGTSDLELTVIGLGTWAIGGDWFMGWGPQEESDSIAAIHEALDCGINWIDTAPAYGFGRCEEVVGKALKQTKYRPYIATKCGVLPGPDGVPTNSLRRKSIEREVEASLQRLGVETIDLFQIHWPRPEEEIEEGFDALLRLQEKGLIRWPAVSNFSVEQMERVSRLGTIVSLQPPYNLLKRDIEAEILPWCSKRNIGVVCYSPMECGLLTGKFSKEWVDNLAPSDWRKARWGRLRAVNYFEEPELSGLVSWVDELRKISQAYDRPVSHLALAWVLRRPEVTSAIVGARKRGQIAETASAAEWNLSEAEITKIEESYRNYQERMGRAV